MIGTRNGNLQSMSRFSATDESQALVAADRSEIWPVLTDPELLAEMTPIVARIDTDGDLWCWQLIRIAVLGVGISSNFTERMRFDDGHRIDFSHEPPAGAVERTGAHGSYRLADAPGGTRLAISLTVHVELPLPRLATPAVTTAMRATMRRSGDRFSANLLRRLART